MNIYTYEVYSEEGDKDERTLDAMKEEEEKKQKKQKERKTSSASESFHRFVH